MDNKLVAFACSLLILVIGVPLIANEIRKLDEPSHIPYINYAPFQIGAVNQSDNGEWTSIENRTWDQVTSDVITMQLLGFQGCIFWDADSFQNRMDEWNDDFVKLCHSHGLTVTFALRFWRQDQFPDNATSLKEFQDFVGYLASNLTSEISTMRYMIYYAWDYDNKTSSYENIISNEYLSALNQTINIIYGNDTKHEIWMGMDFYPSEFVFPMEDLDHISGYGFCGYSYNSVNYVDMDRINGCFEHLQLRGATNIMIAEWGVQTKGFQSPLGFANSEANKVTMIEEFIDAIFTDETSWGYYALHDTNQTDWGIAYTNNTLKLSGDKMQEWLWKEVRG